ncbi:MAG: hypothetical protein EPO68_16590 [Planctomycetota bacterium]|nr:MAG: hypothetical protein EPO68_16590 [Planctomycetota bacterium]
MNLKSVRIGALLCLILGFAIGLATAFVAMRPRVTLLDRPGGIRRVEIADVPAAGSGLSVAWYPSGQISAVGTTQGDARDGHWMFFHANGGLHKAGFYAKGNEIGAWRTFDEAAWQSGSEMLYLPPKVFGSK